MSDLERITWKSDARRIDEKTVDEQKKQYDPLKDNAEFELVLVNYERSQNPDD